MICTAVGIEKQTWRQYAGAAFGGIKLNKKIENSQNLAGCFLVDNLAAA